MVLSEIQCLEEVGWLVPQTQVPAVSSALDISFQWPLVSNIAPSGKASEDQLGDVSSIFCTFHFLALSVPPSFSVVCMALSFIWSRMMHQVELWLWSRVICHRVSSKNTVPSEIQCLDKVGWVVSQTKVSAFRSALGVCPVAIYIRHRPVAKRLRSRFWYFH
ncbi:hypothetical protein CSKR_112904 [Clonorchis sinensis]|uniref:Uncharacterized protein n=1 Tax=Clonorchis sinensis TaxID=79923 RepID=A0A419QIF6_CLOSI|nr:hypothetical protein CSKR_112904 [Clonorchis sinensis]